MIEQLVNNIDFNNYLKSIDKDYRDDLKQDVICELLEKGNDFIFDLHQKNKLANYAIKMAYFKVNDRQKRFSKKYERFNELPNDVNDDTRDVVKDVRLDLTPIEQEYLNALYKCNLNKSKLAKLTGIPRRDLIQIIQAIQNKIKVDNDGYTYTVNYQVKVKIVGDIDTVISEIEAMDNTININCNNGLIINVSKGKL
jgi:hypothetical protein